MGSQDALTMIDEELRGVLIFTGWEGVMLFAIRRSSSESISTTMGSTKDSCLDIELDSDFEAWKKEELEIK